MVAVLVWFALEMKSSPSSVTTFSTAGSLMSASSTRCTTLSVRCSEAASGNETNPTK